jgi:AcrR family transcriptional regulator
MAQKKIPTEDLRVRRTRKLLMEALINLVIEKGFSAISVQDIADRGMVNRATFYRHFRDKHDLLEQYMHEVFMFTAWDEESSQKTLDTDPGNPPAGIVRMFEKVQMHADFFSVMHGPKGDLAFVQGIQQYIEMQLRKRYSSSLRSESPPPDACLSYLSYAGIGVMTWWLKSGQSYTPKQVAAWLVQLNKGVLNEAGMDKP